MWIKFLFVVFSVLKKILNISILLPALHKYGAIRDRSFRGLPEGWNKFWDYLLAVRMSYNHWTQHSSGPWRLNTTRKQQTGFTAVNRRCHETKISVKFSPVHRTKVLRLDMALKFLNTLGVCVPLKMFGREFFACITVRVVFLYSYAHFCHCYQGIWGGADKSLARPGRKQATATKLGIYSTYSPRSSIRLAYCSNFCKPVQKKKSEGCPCNQVSAAAMISASDEKWRPFNFFFSPGNRW